MLDGITIDGLEQIEKLLTEFEAKEARKIIRKVTRQELKPLASKVAQNFPKDSGQTAKDIKVRAAKKMKRGVVGLDVATKSQNFLPKFIEWGTRNPRTGAQHIAPRLTYTEAYTQEGEATKHRIINKTIEEMERALNKESI